MTRAARTALGDAEKRAHLEAGDFLFVENFNERPRLRHPGRGLEPWPWRGVASLVEILDEKKSPASRWARFSASPRQSRAAPRHGRHLYAANLKPGAPVIGLVGKAVTFDTGGISIKPADGMEKMKYDMAGGATCSASCAPLPR